jgi:D-serine deaminase-like pyridoxal phosphate-dependent protein
MASIDALTAHLQAPVAVVDLLALQHNAEDLVRRASGKPIRIATKSVRCRAVLDWALARPGFAGLMAYSLPEALWLARQGAIDVLVAYPTANTEAIASLGDQDDLRTAITLMVDDPAHLRIIESSTSAPIRVCLDIDASLRVGRLHLGVRRSSLRQPGQVLELLHQAMTSPSAQVVGLMCYDAQIAGVPDSSPIVRAMKRRSVADLARRRAAIVAAVRREVELAFVNGAGTGSLGHIAQQADLTEVAAGSGLFGPTLFDGYADFHPEPALVYALPVVRAPAPGIRTVYSGGYLASGPVGPSRVPTPIWPQGLRLLRNEGAGEVQTPVIGPAAEGLSIGERVWWRHAKAGEICERFNELVLVDTEAGSLDRVPTYRGEGRCFG